MGARIEQQKYCQKNMMVGGGGRGGGEKMPLIFSILLNWGSVCCQEFENEMKESF